MKCLAFTIILLSSVFHTYAIEGLLVKTTDYSFKEKWNNTVGSSIPKLTTCDTVFKKQYFYLTAIAWDFSLDMQNISDVRYSIKITKPDNYIYFSQENLPLVNRKISNKKNLQMSDAIIKVCFEDSDLFGKYKIEIQIIDEVSGKSKSIDSDIFLVQLPSYDKFTVDDENTFMKWFEKYYQNPNPESALAYYVFYSQSKLSEKESNFLAIFSLFLEIFRNNKFLLPQLTQCYKNQNEKTKIYLVFLLYYSDIGTSDFFTGLKGNKKVTYLKIKESPLPDIYGEIIDASQLDMLWATFRASGSYLPILKLIQTLDYSKYQGELDKFKKSEQTDDDRQKAIKNAIYDSLIWSIESNCQQHELINKYCNWALQFENLSDVQKDELKKILKK